MSSGTGTVFSWESQSLAGPWVKSTVAIQGRPGMFDDGYCEAGAPPVKLSDGNYFTTWAKSLLNSKGGTDCFFVSAATTRSSMLVSQGGTGGQLGGWCSMVVTLGS